MAVCQIMIKDFLMKGKYSYGKGYDVDDLLSGISFYNWIKEENLTDEINNIIPEKFIFWASRKISNEIKGA